MNQKCFFGAKDNRFPHIHTNCRVSLRSSFIVYQNLGRESVSLHFSENQEYRSLSAFWGVRLLEKVCFEAKGYKIHKLFRADESCKPTLLKTVWRKFFSTAAIFQADTALLKVSMKYYFSGTTEWWSHKSDVNNVGSVKVLSKHAQELVFDSTN